MWFTVLKRRLVKYQKYTSAILAVASIGIFLIIATKFVWPYLTLMKETLSGPVNIFSILNPKSLQVRNENGRTNILLLGIGGGTHDGADLTDSMMVVSVMTDPQKIVGAPIYLISIPRDIWLPDLEDKVNSAYHFGNVKKPGAGLLSAKSAVSQITGLPIHYGFLLDFSTFEKAIDLLGGVDINIENTFDDFKYPIAGKENDTCGGVDPEFNCRYEHLHFDKGPTHLSGNLALKYVRSRYSESEEGTDFARSRRQQLLIEALKAKVFSSETLLSPQKLTDIYRIFKDNIDTDINPNEMGTLAKLVLTYKNSPTKTIVLDLNYFDNPPMDYRGWILLPKDGTFDQIHQFLKTSLEGDKQTSEKKN